jgi:hypothetical protein
MEAASLYLAAIQETLLVSGSLWADEDLRAAKNGGPRYFGAGGSPRNLAAYSKSAGRRLLPALSSKPSASGHSGALGIAVALTTFSIGHVQNEESPACAGDSTQYWQRFRKSYCDPASSKFKTRMF